MEFSEICRFDVFQSPAYVTSSSYAKAWGGDKLTLME
jgi:hypothetical protein